jgi:hypothetical protein
MAANKIALGVIAVATIVATATVHARQAAVRAQQPVPVKQPPIQLHVPHGEASSRPQWIGAAEGEIPAGAMESGRDTDGRPQFVCRASLNGGVYPGRISQGMKGCSIGYGRHEAILAAYEVVVQPGSGGDRTPATSAVTRGFDENGEPYVDQHMPDGSTIRTQKKGVTTIAPDGTQHFKPNTLQYHEAPPPTPPVLPTDPRQGRQWIERHNAALYDVISALVNRDQEEMKKFDRREHDQAGDDLFQQIVYRTRIADFLAAAR